MMPPTKPTFDMRAVYLVPPSWVSVSNHTMAATPKNMTSGLLYSASQRTTYANAARMKNAMVTKPTVIWNHWKNSAAKPHLRPSVLPTQAKMPPDSHPFTVAISAAQSATGKNHRMPPMMRKNTSWKPDEANDGYSYTVITMEAVMAKNPKNVNVRAKLGRPLVPTGPASPVVAVTAGAPV